MKKIVFILFLVLGSFALHATASSDWKEANDLYAKGNYQAAIQLYERLLVSEGESPELYYNLGNAYFKTNEVGRSILNYEKALNLYPLYEDASVNLELANLKVIDNIEDTDTFFIRKWYETLVKMLSSNQWLFLGFFSFLLTLGAVFLFFFGNSVFARKTGFYVGLVSILLSISTFIFSASQKSAVENKQNAIIMSGVVTVKSSPDKSGTDLFQLHEGTKVKITGKLGEWAEVRLSNGNVGWLEIYNIEQI